MSCLRNTSWFQVSPRLYWPLAGVTGGNLVAFEKFSPRKSCVKYRSLSGIPKKSPMIQILKFKDAPDYSIISEVIISN